jgi:hypothetical protein
MHIANGEQLPELEKLLEAMALRRSFFGLKGKLLRGVARELIAAKSGGLTWKAIWEALRKEGFVCGYPQFCRTAKRLVLSQGATQQGDSGKNLLPPSGGKSVERGELRSEEQPKQVNTNQEKPEWQIQREELMARLDREAELNRQREERLRPVKIFKPNPFVGRGEE